MRTVNKLSTNYLYIFYAKRKTLVDVVSTRVCVELVTGLEPATCSLRMRKQGAQVRIYAV